MHVKLVIFNWIHHCEAKVYTVAQKQEIHCSEFDANITNNEILKGWMVC